MPLRRIAAGIDLLAQIEGGGSPVQRGDAVTYNPRIYLNWGEEALINERQAETGMPPDKLRTADGRVLVDHRTVLGKRQCVAGIEKSLLGMRRGGYRRVRISPHLAYGERGVPGLIPADAVLEVEIWLRDIEPKKDSRCRLGHRGQPHFGGHNTYFRSARISGDTIPISGRPA